ncbi:MAG: helix-turn-helix domain-containing protein [Alphaproteobacteria bacterium]
MTPFGRRMRELRQAQGLTLKEMAARLDVSAAYLSALEHGKRGRPNRVFLIQVVGVLGLDWDEQDEIERLAVLSHPRVTVDTQGLAPEATLVANLLAERIGGLDPETLDVLLGILRGDGAGTRPKE